MRAIALFAALVASASAAAQQAEMPPAVPPEKAAKALASIRLENPGFESTEPGRLGAPPGWWAVQHAGPESYRFTLDRTDPKSGKQSLRVENIGPEPFGTVYQYVDATAHRGRTLRFAAWVRTQDTKGNVYASGAGLHLQSQRAGGYPRDTALMRKNAVAGTTGWTRYELSLVVAEDVTRVEVGLNLFGPGIAWIDDAALDVVEAQAPSKP
jgi:hypothetical protein